jgi:ferredoxin
MTEITIDQERCSGCRRCVDICPSLLYVFAEKKAAVRGDGARDCILCGQCLAACGEDAIAITSLPPTELRLLPERAERAAELVALLEERRSVRAYREDDVPADHGVHAALTFGFPKVPYRKSIRRPFASVSFR